VGLRSDLADPRIARRITDDIRRLAGRIPRRVRIMEVCGTHTVSLRRSGIHSLLPENVSLISGPGCPVCVTPTGYIDNALRLADEKDVLIATFGDMLKVPGREGRSLSDLASERRVRILYSPAELPRLASETNGPVVFLGIGFETTIPTVASVFLQARRSEISNLYLYTAFKTVPGALKALLADPEHRIDGFLLPGHVSVIIGRRAYLFLERQGGVPGVIAGFEPVDMLLGISRLLAQLASSREGARTESGYPRVENAYPRAVREDGNGKARAVMDELLEPRDDRWRGLGMIPASGMGLRPEHRALDAAVVFGLPEPESYDPPGCLCARVIQGKAVPPECGLFGTRCTPDRPVGPCMVSSEGTCAAYLRYGDPARVHGSGGGGAGDGAQRHEAG